MNKIYVNKAPEGMCVYQSPFMGGWDTSSCLRSFYILYHFIQLVQLHYLVQYEWVLYLFIFRKEYDLGDYLGGLCTPISLLVLGGVLTTLPLKKLFTNWKIYYVCFIKLIVFPLIVYVIAKYVLCLGDEMSMFTMIMSGLPTASLTNMFAELYDIEPGYAATSVGMTTVFSVATLPLIVYIAQLI